MSCVLRVDGPEFDVDAYLKQSTLRPHDVFRKGERRSSSKINEESGFTVSSSDAAFEDLPAQIKDTIRFLQQNSPELTKLKVFPGVAGIWVDFGFNNRMNGKLASCRSMFFHRNCSSFVERLVLI